MPSPRAFSALLVFLRTFIPTAVPVLTLLFSISAPAQTFTVLHTFTGGKDGGYPFAGLTVDKHNNLYGTANVGGNLKAPCPPVNTGCGLIYQLKPSRSGWNFHPLHLFHGGKDGEGPYGRVILGPNGNKIYGTTLEGGNEQACLSGCGMVFSLSRPASCKTGNCPWKETILYRFQGNTDGFYPSGDLTFDASGNIFGTTTQGGSFGPGTVYELSPGKDWTESILWNFTGIDDGGNPYSGIAFDSAGNVYATTLQGGENNGGAVVELDLSQSVWNETNFYNFHGSSGVFPFAGLLLDNSGSLIGACASGGPGKNGGTVYQVTPSGGRLDFSVLYNFPGGDESGPYAKLTMDAGGNLYGTTQGDPSNGNWGTVFKLTRSKNGKWKETILHAFTGGSDGGYPLGSVVLDSNGNVFGTTNLGGEGYGVVFEIKP